MALYLISCSQLNKFECKKTSMSTVEEQLFALITLYISN